MGDCFSKGNGEPVDIAAREDFQGPVKERSCTDIIGTVLLIAFAISLFGLVGYCAINGDIYRVIYGYDNCGNVCGRINEKEDDPLFSCKGGDFRDRKYLLIENPKKAIISAKNVKKECVKDCNVYPNYQAFLNRCIPKQDSGSVKKFISNTGIKDFFNEVSEDLHHTYFEIFGLCIIALVMSIIMLFLLKLFAGFMVWVILIGTLGLSIVATIYTWILWKQKKNEQVQDSQTSMTNDNNEASVSIDNKNDEAKTDTYLAFAIIATIVSVIIFLVIVVLRKRIQLVVELFHEAGKAIGKMPLLLIQPIFTVLALAVVMALWISFTILVQSAGHLALADPSYYYKKDITMKVTRWYNLFGMLWMTQFCIGCQHMIIAGSVAAWFFTRDKESLSSPILSSAYNLVRYHLGSVALASLFIAIFQFIRAILKAIENYLKESENDFLKLLLKCCQCCLGCCEKILMYVTRNAYIELAIYGKSFCTSGQQAFKVLVNNALRVTAINTVGDFVLAMAKVLVVIVTVLVGVYVIGEKEGVHHLWIPIVIAGLFAYFVAHCFFTVYEMVIDTIFICFCEDCEMNDGINKPYFMSRNLMEFVKNSKKVLKVGDSPVQTPLRKM